MRAKGRGKGERRTLRETVVAFIHVQAFLCFFDDDRAPSKNFSATCDAAALPLRTSFLAPDHSTNPPPSDEDGRAQSSSRRDLRGPWHQKTTFPPAAVKHLGHVAILGRAHHATNTILANGQTTVLLVVVLVVTPLALILLALLRLPRFASFSSFSALLSRAAWLPSRPCSWAEVCSKNSRVVCQSENLQRPTPSQTF